MTDAGGGSVRARFAADEAALGAIDTTYSTTAIELYGELGTDFVWVDLEHGGPSPTDAERLSELLLAAERTGAELLVRLPSANPSQVRKALDAGVRTLFLPRVEDPDVIREAVAAGRFRYDGGPGQRGLASPRARRWGLVENYHKREDRETLIGVTVESRGAVNAIDEILAVPELGFVFVGPFDLSASLGHPGEVDHPEVRAAVETVRDRCLEAGVPLGGLGLGPEDVRRKLEEGYRLLTLGSTTGALRSAVEEWLENAGR